MVVGEAGKQIKTLVMTDVIFKIKETTFEWPVYVAPIQVDILLGCDIIDDENITINTKKGIQIDDLWIDCEVTRTKVKPSPVAVYRAVTIPAYSEFIMQGVCNEITEEERTTYLFESTDEMKDRLMIARSAISPDSNKIPIRIMNTSQRLIKLKKCFVLGNLHAVGTVSSSGKSIDISRHEEGHSICRL